METLARTLSEHPVLRGMPARQLELLAGCARNARFDGGSYLIREGDDADVLFLLRYGRVAVEVHEPSRGAITIQTLDGQDVLGWSWSVPPYKACFHARAVTLVRAIALDAVCLREKLRTDHELGFELMQRILPVMAERLQAARMQLLDLYGAPRPSAGRAGE